MIPYLYMSGSCSALCSCAECFSLSDSVFFYSNSNLYLYQFLYGMLLGAVPSIACID